jgi:hypothetical protein
MSTCVDETGEVHDPVDNQSCRSTESKDDRNDWTLTVVACRNKKRLERLMIKVLSLESSLSFLQLVYILGWIDTPANARSQRCVRDRCIYQISRRQCVGDQE